MRTPGLLRPEPAGGRSRGSGRRATRPARSGADGIAGAPRVAGDDLLLRARR